MLFRSRQWPNLYFILVTDRPEAGRSCFQAIAFGSKLRFNAQNTKPYLHAMQVRINCEDPQDNFSPNAGVITSYSDPTISEPIDITAGSDGALWFTNYGNSTIGRAGDSSTAAARSGAVTTCSRQGHDRGTPSSRQSTTGPSHRSTDPDRRDRRSSEQGPSRHESSAMSRSR